jgi:hypothetical protein
MINVNETFRETLWLGITKKAVMSSMGIQKMTVKTLWRSQSPPK